MLAPLEFVPQKYQQYAERVQAGEAMRTVAIDFVRDYGSEDVGFFRIGYYAHLLGGDIQLDFQWLDLALELSEPLG